jgi:hypothetical protein
MVRFLISPPGMPGMSRLGCPQGARRAGQAVTASPATRLTGSDTRAEPAGPQHGQRSGLSFMMRS